MAIATTASPPFKSDKTTYFGDFVSTEDEQIDLEDVAEPWYKYDLKKTSRVFYPICVGELLDERYLIEHKIGSGGFSTVWMAYDLQDKRDTALKVAFVCEAAIWTMLESNGSYLTFLASRSNL